MCLENNYIISKKINSQAYYQSNYGVYIYFAKPSRLIVAEFGPNVVVITHSGVLICLFIMAFSNFSQSHL
jgi:hypothetical protein